MAKTKTVTFQWEGKNKAGQKMSVMLAKGKK